MWNLATPLGPLLRRRWGILPPWGSMRWSRPYFLIALTPPGIPVIAAYAALAVTADAVTGTTGAKGWLIVGGSAVWRRAPFIVVVLIAGATAALLRLGGLA